MLQSSKLQNALMHLLFIAVHPLEQVTALVVETNNSARQTWNKCFLIVHTRCRDILLKFEKLPKFVESH